MVVNWRNLFTDIPTSHDSNVEQLLERLAQTESRLIQLEAVCSTYDDREVLSATHWGGMEATDISSQSQSTLSPQSPSWSDYHQSRRSDGGTVSTELPSTGRSSRRETVTSLDQDSNFGSVNPHTKELYFGKEPLLCEELRCGFPNVISKYKPSEVGDISRIKQDFLDHVRNLYPVICEGTLCMATDLVQAQGFHENHQSCLVLFIIAVTKAYVNSNDTESGLADYQRAMQLRSQLGSQLTLRYVHILVFTALFLLKKDRILDFAFALHASSTILHTVLTRLADISLSPKSKLTFCAYAEIEVKALSGLGMKRIISGSSFGSAIVLSGRVPDHIYGFCGC